MGKFTAKFTTKFTTKFVAKSRMLEAAALLVAVGLSMPALAADKTPFEMHRWQHIGFAENGLATIDYEEDALINSEAVIQAFGQIRIPNNDHFVDLEIVEAATLKADGRRIEVAREHIFKMTGTAEGAALFSADSTVRVIPFPDLGVGDRRIVHIRRHEKAQRIPGAISETILFQTATGKIIEDVSVDLPDDLHLHVAESELSHSEEIIPGGRRLSWHTELKRSRTAEPLAIAPIDHMPHVLISNSADWGEFGRIYGTELTQAVDIDPAIIAQANEITTGLTERRDIARALFDWTSRNIRYFNVVLGSGGFFPHAPASILALRYGDCKDHAALLRAFLAAKGIESEHTLINLSRVYGDYSLPIPSFDHMILYVPEFALYLDPTDPTSNFDALSPALRDKPVVRVRADGAIADRTKLNAAQDAAVVLTSAITIGEDGRASGTSTVEGRGPLAESLRASAQRIAVDDNEFAQTLLTMQNSRGSGSFEAPSFLDKADPYRIDATFQLDRPFFGAKGPANAVPTGPRLFARPNEALQRGVASNWVETFACGIPQTYTERVRIIWPASVVLKGAPANVNVTAGQASYQATYVLAGNSLAVERVFRFNPPHAFCKPAELAAVAEVLSAAEQDFGVRLVLVTAPKPVAAPIAPEQISITQ
jgi:hypothetical protein